MRRTVVSLMLVLSVFCAEGASALEWSYPEHATSTAVIRFKNMTGDPSLDWLSNSVTDVFYDDLRLVSNLENHTAFNMPFLKIVYKDVNSIPDEEIIALAKKEKKLEHIWMGKIRGGKDGLSIELTVVDVATGEKIKVKEYSGDIAGLQRRSSEVTLEVLGELGIEVKEHEKARVLSIGTSSVEAWKLFYDGAEYLLELLIDDAYKNFSKEQIVGYIQKAIAAWNAAVVVDPDYTDALEALGIWYQSIGEKELSFEAFAKALSVKPYLIDANQGLGNALIEKGDLDRGFYHLRQAISTNPSLMDTYDELLRNLINERKEEGLALAIEMMKAPYLPVIEKGVIFQFAFGDRSVIVATLKERIRDDNVSIREYVIETLGKSGGREVVPDLIGALADENQEIRTLAVDALGNIGDRRAVPPLLQLLKSADEDLTADIESSLSSMVNDSDVPALVQMLNESDFSIQSVVLQLLGDIRDASSVPAILAVLNSQDENVRKRAVSALGAIGDVSVVPALIEMMGDSGDHLRWSLIYALGLLGDKKAVPALIEALGDSNKEVRSIAASSLGKIGDRSTVPVLIEVLRDPDYWTRCSALEALGAIRDASAVPAIIDMLGDENWLVRKNAAWALGKLDDKSAVPALIEALKDEHEIVRSQAAQSLGKMKNAEVIEPLLEATKDPNKYVSLDAAVSLAEMGEKSSIPALKQALEGEVDKANVWEIIAEVLKEYGEVNPMAFYEMRYRFQYAKNIRNRAAEALSGLGEVDAVYDAFKRFHVDTNILILNQVRKHLLFSEKTEKLTASIDDYLRAAGYYIMALKAREEGRYDEQLKHADEALGQIKPKDNTGLYVLSLWLKAQAQLKLGMANDAIQTVEDAEGKLRYMSRYLRESYKELFEEFTLFMKGEAYAAAGEGKKAVKAYEDALAALNSKRQYFIDEDDIGKLRAMVLTSLGALQLKLGKDNLEKAVAGGREYEANDSLEMENEEKRYLELSRQKIAEGDYEEAHKLVEELNLRRTKYITRRMNLNFADPEKQKLVQEYQRRQEEIDEISKQIESIARESTEGGGKAEDNPKVKELENERNRKRRELNVYLTKLKKTHPDMAALMGAKPVELSAVQEQLPGDAAVLQYMMLPDKLVIFVLRNSGIDIVEAQVQKEALEKNVRRLRRELYAPVRGEDSSQLEPLAKELYGTLIAPVKKAGMLNGIKVLGIAPNGFLHQLPFGVLLSEGEEHLIDLYDLFYINSTSMLGVAMQRESERGQENTLLAISNPDGSLEYADNEVREIAKHFGNKKLYSQDEAKKVVIQKRDERFTIVHLSTHGVFDPVDSTKSHLVMADGNLTVEEIWGLPLKGVALTVLSACETGLGEVLSGDDIVSMENAFIFAGSPSVLATLWKVEDKSTAELMDLFYKNLMAGMTKTEALSEAQRRLKEKYKEPFFWAAFTLRGDWR